MCFEELKQNLIGLVKESQIKLGYSDTSCHLYYPAEALNHLLATELTIPQLENALQEFSTYAAKELGSVTVSHKGEQFCLTVPREGTAYVHEHVEDNGFLQAFMDCMRDGHCTIEEIISVFHRFSDHVTVEKTNHEEFDYLIYFTDGSPDTYRYCLHEEMGHMIYHRFTPREFEAFAF